MRRVPWETAPGARVTRSLKLRSLEGMFCNCLRSMSCPTSSRSTVSWERSSDILEGAPGRLVRRRKSRRTRCPTWSRTRHPSLRIEAVLGGQDFVVSHRQTVPAVDAGDIGFEDQEFVGLRPPGPDLDPGQRTSVEFPYGPLQRRNLTLGHTRISRPQDTDQEQDN